MRDVSARFAATLADPVEWVTTVDLSNDGGSSWTRVEFVSGTATESALSQTRWAADVLALTDFPVSPYSTRMRVRHGQPGEMLGMGHYRITETETSSSGRGFVRLRGESYESYLRSARLPKSRTIYGGSCRGIVTSLIREVLPDAVIAWEIPDEIMPTTVLERDRWEFIDGPRDVASIARRLGARIYAGPVGDWVVRAVPSLADEPVWTASEGEGGVLLEHGVRSSTEGVYNAVVVTGAPSDPKKGWSGRVILVDSDPNSPTYYYLSPDAGGFGPCPRFYQSSLFTSWRQAYDMAAGTLKQTLGLRRAVTFTTLHDPRLQPGDVGLVHTVDGPVSVLLDEVVHDLTGAPTTGTTRTVAATATGGLMDVLEEGGDG